MIPNSSLIVSSVEPTGANRKKVWMQKTETDSKIYVKNDNDVYEEFIKKEDGKIIKTLESTTPSSDGEFLSGLNGITKILGFQIYNYEQWREGYLCGTLVTNKEGTSLYFLTNPDTTSYYGKPIRIFYID